MGLFDNVNWQQMLPVAMSAFAGGMDPRSGPMLAQSGWNSVQAYMRQQNMQQEQEQFKERMKLYQQEMGFRQKESDRQEKRFDLEQEDRYAADFILSNIEALGEMDENAGDSAYYNRLNAMRKEQGGTPIPYSVYAKVRDQMEFVPTPTGEFGFGIGPDGNVAFLEKYKVGKGKVKWRAAKSDIRMSPEVLKQAKESPELALQAADQLEKSGKKEIAGTLRGIAERTLGEKRQAAFEKSYAESINEVKAVRKAMEDTHKMQFSEENRPVDPDKAAQWERRRDDSLRAMQEHTNERFDRLTRMRMEADPEFKKQYEKEKRRSAESFEKSLSDYEMQMYTWMIKDLKDSGVAMEEAGRTARATIELQRKRATRPAPPGIPGDITAPGYKRPTVAPPGQGASPMPGQGVPMPGAGTMMSRVGVPVPTPSVPPNYVPGTQRLHETVEGGKTIAANRLRQEIERAKRRGDAARVRRLEQQLNDLLNK